MADLGNLTAYLRADMRDFSTKLQKATKNLKTFTVKTEGLLRANEQSFKRLGSAVKKIGGTISKWVKRMSIAIVGAIGLSVKAFADFEEQLANVSTMLDDQTMKYIPKYARRLKQMAVEFGESTKTLSKGLYDILSASIEPAKALDVLSASTIAAKAGLTDTGVAADAITTILNSYQMSAEEAGKVSDWLFAIVKRGKTTFAELAPNIGKIASTASVAGLAFEEVGAAIATMTRAGMSTELATTSLRGLMNTFMKSGPEAKEMAKQFGFELNTTTLRTIGLTGVLKKLKGATAEQLAILLPNIRALSGFAAALKQAEGMASDLDLMLNSAGLTQKAFGKMTDTLSFQLKRFWQAIKVISVGVGERFKKSIIDMTDSLIKNRYVIEDWAVAFADRIIFVGDIIKSFLEFMKTDWKVGLKFAVKTATELFFGLGKSIVVIMRTAGVNAAAAFIEAYGKQVGTWLMEESGVKKPTGEHRTGLEMLAKYPISGGYRKEMMKMGAGLYEASMKPATTTDLRGDLKDVWSEVEKNLKDFENKLDIDIISGPLAKLKAKDSQRLLDTMARKLDALGEKAQDVNDAISNTVGKGGNPVGTVPTKQLTEEEKKAQAELAQHIEDLRRKLLSELGRMDEKTYQFRKKLLDDELKDYAKFIEDKALLDQWYDEQVRKLDIERLKSSDSLTDGFKSAQLEMANEIKTFGEIGNEVAYKIRDSFANAFADMILDAKDFKEAATGFLKSIASAMVQIMSMQIATKLMMGFGFGASTAPAGDINPAMANYAHSGGIVGAGMQQKAIPQMVFSQAPRLHAGLQADEFPAILQRGERVIPKGQAAGGANVEVNVINQTGRPVDAEKGQTEFDGEKYITNVVLKDIHSYGPMRNAIQQMGVK